MGKRRMHYFAAGFGALVLAVVVLLVQSGTRRSDEIILAQPVSDGTSGSAGGEQSEILRSVRLTPETVQLAINTLSRPVTYSRSQMVELFWSGGKGETASTVAVSGSRTRVDTAGPGGTRHMLVREARRRCGTMMRRSGPCFARRISPPTRRQGCPPMRRCFCCR